MTKSSKTKVQQVSPEIVQIIIDGSLALDEEKAIARVEKVSRATNFLFKTTIVGAENIPKGPVLYISNHSTMAMDVFVALPALTKASGRFCRGMNDEIFYRNETTRNYMVDRVGAVMGHSEIGSAMFKARKDILLFPGGAYEANKNLDQRYTLQWKKRTGFVRMAAKHGIPIVPVGIVGPDEWFSRYMDRDEIANSWLGKLLRRMGVSDESMQSDQFPPIPRGIFGTMIPRPQPTYVCIGGPISTSKFKGKEISQKDQEQVRDITKERLENCIGKMLLQQAQDRDRRGIVRRFLSFY